MLDLYTHPSVSIGYLDAATFAFGWVTNCMHQDGWMQCFMYFGAPASDATKTVAADGAAAPAETGMVTTILTMLGVPSFIISLLAMAGLK